MKIWVVTGPIGSGKSTVSALLSRRGAAVVNGDQLGHQVLEIPSVMEKIAKKFGDDFIFQGEVDRRKLGALVFSDQSSMDYLNDISHPPLVKLVEQRLDKLAVDGQHGLAVLEAAVYFLWPPLKMVDMIISVVADPDIRRNRLVETRGLSTEEVEGRMMAQENLEHFWPTADVIIDNSFHPEDLAKAVDELLRKNNF